MTEDRYARKLDRLEADRRHAARTCREEAESLRAASRRAEEAAAAQAFVQSVAEAVQQAAHQQVSAVVTRCLRAVFGEGCHSFRIAFEQKRGRTEARLLFVNPDGIDEEPGDGVCGGMIDVAALALRLVCLMLGRPRKRPLIVADEPMKNVNGKQYQDRVGDLIETLAEETGIQFIIVTDDDWLKIGKVIQL